MRVSVIIPVYNHEEYVAKALQSVYAQTHKDIEVVLVDDFSKDQSVAVVDAIISSKEWKARFGKDGTKFTKFKENQGAHNAINYGLKQATGDAMAILNSDDYFHPARFAEMLVPVEQGKTDLVFSGVEYVDEKNKPLYPTQSTYVHTLKHYQDTIRRYPSVGFSTITRNVALTTGNFLFTRSLFEKVGIFKDYRYCHDYDFLLRCLFYTEPVFIERPLYFYRLHLSNTISDIDDDGRKEGENLVQNFFGMIKTGKPENPLCPCESNWPGLFIAYIDHTGLKDVYLNS
ncbi:MAG: glycosyltransferase [Hyphomicrobiales bacterium]|nr:glycosyltransferase [Hyphomicrobiales bacterium]